MQTTSATYDRILAGTDISYETQLVIDDVGTYGESDLMSISTNIEMFQEDPDIGKAIASEINVLMLNPLEPIPTMARIRPQVKAKGIAPKSSKVTIVDEDLASEYATYSDENITFSAASGATVVGESLTFAVDSTEYLESEWIAQGIFYIDTREITANNNGLDILTIHGFDAMLKTEQMYSSNATVGDALDISYVQSIADAIGVAVDPRTWGIMGTGYMIPFPVGYSMREILGYIASAYAGCFIISDVGQLRLVALEDIESETRYLINEIGDVIIFGVDSHEHTVTASGAVATFTAGGEYPLDDLQVAIEPVQDLHGYDNPWPSGGGDNKLVAGTWVVGQYNNGVWSGDLTRRTSEYCPISPNVQYTISIDPSENKNLAWINYNYFDENKQWLGSRTDNGDASFNGQRTHTFTITNSSAKYVRLTARAYSSSGLDISTWDIDAALPQLNEGASVITPWTPYENLCPISGWTGMDIYQSDNAPQTFIDGKYYNDNGVLTNTANTRYEAEYIPVSIGKSYTFKFGATSTNRLRVHEYDSNETRLRQVISTQVSTTEISYKPSNDASYIRFSYPIACNTVNLYLKEIPISWQTEAGTVYKGTLNVKTGVLTAIWKYKEYTGLSSESWNYSTWSATNTYAFYSTISLNDAYYPSNNYNCIVLCNQVPCSNYNSLRNTDVPAIAISGGSASSIWTSIRVPKTAISEGTASAFRTYLESNPLDILYELATPLTFQLTPTQVQTLVGQNNLWANTGNIINLEFTEPASEAVRILV